MATLDKIPTNDTNLPVRLILCFDGTGDEAKGKDSIHTISRMCKKGRVTDSQGKEFFQVVEYIKGPATDSKNKPFVGNWIKNMIDGATGWECQEILIAGYEFCCENLKQGELDEIFLFGFSRGAFISRALASFLQYVGLVKPNVRSVHKKGGYSKLLREYTSRSAKPEPQGVPEFCNPSPRVRFLGAFDTVKAIHRLPIPGFLRRTIDLKMDAPHIVDHFRHALALNESRPLFNPDLWGSKKISESNTFEEAWFFGHHRDMGGGSAHQGLALWPLQWIIGAAKDYGLVLHSDVEHHDVLFPGSPIHVETKDQIAMKMFDMVHRHKETRYNPRLNTPNNILKIIPLKLIPRNYRQYFKKTSDPLDSKIYLHPSAYLIFDVSASFRLQVHEWRYFHDYMKDRYRSLRNLEKPWWEEQTVKSIVRARSAAQHLNILIYGDIGNAEFALLAANFGKEVEIPANGSPPSSSINTPMKLDNHQVCIYRSDGSEEVEQMQSFLIQHSKDDDDKLHAIWFFLDCKNKEMDDKQKKFLALKFNGVPIHIVVVNHDNSWSNYLTATPLKLFNAVQSRILPFGHIKTPVDRKINEAKAVIEDLEHRVNTISVPVKSFVRGDGNHVATIKALYKETSISLEKEARLAQIKAQRSSVKPSIALANEETVRAYTIWYRNKFHKEQTEFRRNKDKTIKSLSVKLLEPILETFNSRFEGDDEVIRKSLGDTWDGLDDYRPDLFDTEIPGHLIVRCMVDATIVLIYACYFQSISKEEKASPDIARPFKPEDIEIACAWYKKSRQDSVHGEIKMLLSGEGDSPKGNSISDFQMEFFKMVEVEKAVIKAKEEAAKWFWQRWLEV